MKSRREELWCSTRQPGAWFEFPVAVLGGDRVVGWAGSKRSARLIVDLYELRGDPVAQTRQLLDRLTQPQRGNLASAPLRFEVESAGDRLIPGHGHALKWDGAPVAWLSDAALAASLAGVLNAFIHAFRRNHGRVPFTVRRSAPRPVADLRELTFGRVA